MGPEQGSSTRTHSLAQERPSHHVSVCVAYSPFKVIHEAPSIVAREVHPIIRHCPAHALNVPRVVIKPEVIPESLLQRLLTLMGHRHTILSHLQLNADAGSTLRPLYACGAVA